jgi:hypothetical protein
VRAGALLSAVLDRAYPYDMDFHRDLSLAPLRGLPIMARMGLGGGHD